MAILKSDFGIFVILLFIILISFGITKTRFLTNGNESNYHIYPISIPQKVSFAGEEISLDDQDLFERLLGDGNQLGIKNIKRQLSLIL